MRIIAGYLGGRVFDAPSGHRTKPMSSKMVGAIFNALGDVEGLTVLDPFAGSGALSFEAVSRGAKSAIAIDIDKGAISQIVNSANLLGISDKVKAIRANASGWSENNPDKLFDLVLCDPPYDDIQTKLLVKLSKHVSSGGLFILSLPPRFEINLPDHFKLLAKKDYGDSSLLIYRNML